LKPILVKNAELMTFGQQSGVIHGGSVLIRNGVIESIGAVPVPLDPDTEVIDAGGRVATPGLVNAHMHLYSTFACGIAAEASRNFGEILSNLWWRLDRALTLEDVELSAMVPAIRCLKAGVTTIVDHHASYGATAGSLGVVAEAVQGLGLRACLAYEVSDRNGPEKTETAIAENMNFIDALTMMGSPDLAAMFGLHASFTLSDETLKRCADAAHDTGFHIHCAEDKADLEDAIARGATGVVDRLESFGILGPRSIAAHCIHVSPGEMSTLARHDTMVVTNPQSNMNNAVGTASVDELLRAGCTVGMGTDGMTADILEEARALFMSHRQRTGDPTVMFLEAADMVTKTNPGIASRIFGRPIGVLEEGAAGDVVLWDYVPPTPLEKDNVAGHLLFGLPSTRPLTVVSRGRVAVRDFKVLDIDEEVVADESRSLARALWDRW